MIFKGADAIKPKARKITANCATDAERIASINDFVHSTIRYVAMEHGEFSHRHDLPSDVAEALTRQPDNPDFLLTHALLNKKRFRREDTLKDADAAISLGANLEQVKAMLAL